MSRGAEHTTRQLTDQQLAQQNQLISQSNQEGGQDRSLLVPTIQSLLTSTGYTPQQQSDITQQSLGAANTAYDACLLYTSVIECKERIIGRIVWGSVKTATK